MQRFVRSVFALVTALGAAPGLAQPPSVTHAVPAACAPGQATNVALYGANLAGATGVWTTIRGASIALAPGIEANGTKADTIVYQFTLPAEVPVGIYGVRLATPQGISSLRLVMVDDLPSAEDNGNNKTLETAQPLTLPVAVDGTCEAESYDFYKFTASPGQRVSVEVVGRRLGSALDAVIRLLDAAGHELAYSDDEGPTGADGRFAYQFSAAGDYFIEIRDIRYLGGAGYRYRLRLGDFPLASAPFPLAGQKGTVPKVVIAGAEADGLAPLGVAVPRDVAGGRLPLGVRFPDGQGSAAVALIASDGPEQVEIEPNDAPEAGSSLVLPGAVSGRFEVAGDRDWFVVEAKAGMRFSFAGRTRSLGSPADLFLRLHKADGAVLSEAEDAGTDEGVIDFTFPEDGTYRLVVEDLHQHGGAEFVYRIEVEPYRPGFTLAVEADKFDAPKGGVFVAKVTSVRRDYNGPITLSVVGAGEGFALANNVIPEGKNETVVSVTLPAGLEPGQLVTMNLVGQAKIGEADFTATASTLVPLRALFSGLPYPPADLEGSIGLGVGPVFADFFQLAVDPAPVLFPQVAGATSFLVKVTKLNGFDDPIALAVEGLPAGVTATLAGIEKGKAEVAVQLSGPGSLAEGDYTFRVTGSAAFQNQPRQVVLDNAVLRVVKPIEAVAVPAGPLARGATQKVKLVVTRHPGATGPVTLVLRNLPAGVTAPAELTVAEGQNEIEVDLTAAADALLGQARVTVVATTKVKEKAVTVESLPVALDVTMP